MNNIIFEVGDIVEVVGPVLNMPYSGLFKVSCNPMKRDGIWIKLVPLTHPVPTLLGYYFEENCLYVVPSDELTFKLIKYLDK